MPRSRVRVPFAPPSVANLAAFSFAPYFRLFIASPTQTEAERRTRRSLPPSNSLQDPGTEQEDTDVAARRTRRSPTMKKKQQAAPDSVQGTPLEPIRYVTRELTRPDGSKLSVKVPVSASTIGPASSSVF